jgi:hypothetical protein
VCVCVCECEGERHRLCLREIERDEENRKRVKERKKDCVHGREGERETKTWCERD